MARSASNRVFSNFLAVGSGEAIGRLLAFGAMLYAARHVGTAGYGVIAFVGSLTLYLGKVADFGIESVGAAEVAKNRPQVSRVGSAILSLRLALATVVTLVATGIAALLAQDSERTVFALYFLTLLPIAASTKWIHLGLEVARPIGVWRVAGEALSLALVIAFVRDARDLWRIPAAILIGDSLVAVALLRLLLRQGYALAPRWNPEIAFPVFKRALPVVGVFLLGLLIYNMDIVFLKFMQSTEVVGFYAAAYSLIGFLANVCTAYGITLLPTLTRLSERGEQQHLYQTAMAQIFALTLPISVGGMFVAQRATQLVFGEAYEPSGPILRILVWTVLPYALRVVSWAALVAQGHQRLALRAIIYSVFANAALNLVLIHLYGMAGAAAASVATEALAGALTLYYAFRQGLSVPPLARLWRPVVAVLTMAAALGILWKAHLMLQLGAGITTYGLMLFCIGGIKLRGRVPALAV
jgi:O-antigen/teichoic acid export membrane protein